MEMLVNVSFLQAEMLEDLQDVVYLMARRFCYGSKMVLMETHGVSMGKLLIQMVHSCRPNF